MLFSKTAPLTRAQKDASWSRHFRCLQLTLLCTPHLQLPITSSPDPGGFLRGMLFAWFSPGLPAWKERNTLLVWGRFPISVLGASGSEAHNLFGLGFHEVISLPQTHESEYQLWNNTTLSLKKQQQKCIYVLCMNALPACMYVHHVLACWISWNWSDDGCEPSFGCWQWNRGPMQEQCSLLLSHLSSPNIHNFSMC